MSFLVLAILFLVAQCAQAAEPTTNRRPPEVVTIAELNNRELQMAVGQTNAQIESAQLYLEKLARQKTDLQAEIDKRAKAKPE